MMTPCDLVLIVQGVASAAMCGIIWFVQVVHYPLFARSGGDERAFARENKRLTSRVVIPFMLAEGLTAAVIAWAPPVGVPRAVAWLGLAAVVAVWLSTGLVQMPLHARLASDGHLPVVIGALVRSNWVRTALWTLRAALAGWMLRAAG